MKITHVWIVRDPNSLSELGDLLFQATIEDLPKHVIGTGLRAWREENTAVYTDEAEARADAEARMAELIALETTHTQETQ